MDLAVLLNCVYCCLCVYLYHLVRQNRKNKIDALPVASTDLPTDPETGLPYGSIDMLRTNAGTTRAVLRRR